MMLETQSLADELKSSTDDLHRHAETRDLQRRMAKGELPRATFARYLAQLALVHEAMEAALRSAAASDPSVGALWCETRAHTARLQEDVAAHGLSPAAPLPATQALIDDLARTAESHPTGLLGAFYVLEGSMNGNRFIAKALAGAYRLAPGGPGLSYLDPYGASQRERWLEFRAGLDGLTVDEQVRAAILGCARGMFAGIAAISDEVIAHGD